LWNRPARDRPVDEIHPREKEKRMRARLHATRRRPAPAIAVLLGLAALGLAASAVAAAGEAVPHIWNEATPSEGRQIVELEEQWRIGADDEDLLLGLVTAVAGDEAGNIYLLDGQLSQVLVLSPEGRFLRALGREGQGPGEFQNPAGLVILSDGRVGVLQAAPGKLILLDPQSGDPAGTTTIGGDDPTRGGFSMAQEVSSRDGHLAVVGRRMTPGENGFDRRLYLSSLAEDGTERVCFFERQAPDNIARGRFVERDEYFVDRGRWALGPGGTVYAAPERDRYAIHAYSADGVLQRVIEREFSPWKRTAEEKGRVGSGLLVVINGERVPIEAEAEDHDPCILGLHVTAGEELWVLSSRSRREQPEGILQTYDVFDPQGRFVRQVAFAVAGDAERDRLFLLGEDRAVLVTGFVDAARASIGAGDDDEAADEAAPLEVIGYRIVPG
jgi:hypothetical protein